MTIECARRWKSRSPRRKNAWYEGVVPDVSGLYAGAEVDVGEVQDESRTGCLVSCAMSSLPPSWIRLCLAKASASAETAPQVEQLNSAD